MSNVKKSKTILSDFEYTFDNGVYNIVYNEYYIHGGNKYKLYFDLESLDGLLYFITDLKSESSDFEIFTNCPYDDYSVNEEFYKFESFYSNGNNELKLNLSKNSSEENYILHNTKEASILRFKENGIVEKEYWIDNKHLLDISNDKQFDRYLKLNNIC